MKDVLEFNPLGFQKSLLDWYDISHRALPWRAGPGNLSNPYYVWLSEIMLQQTTVPTVKSYFENFKEKWPTIHHLSQASLDEVLHAWQGLGYYARARNLHKCANHIVKIHQGIFPSTSSELINLPGIGPYTAAAIASIAFNEPATVVDGNVERVISRIFKIETPLPSSKAEIKHYAQKLTSQDRPGDYAQAMMDIGATICRPVNPLCMLCPISQFCEAYKAGCAEDFPRKIAKGAKPTRYGVVFWIINEKGQILIQKRPLKGLLAGLMEIPSSPWVPHDKAALIDVSQGPASLGWQFLEGEVRHTFTHFHLVLKVAWAKSQTSDGEWTNPDNFHSFAFPTVMKKVIHHALKYGPKALAL
jgi:A/G-specific adenine glycosylase